MDPLAIASGSAALAQLCIKLSFGIGSFVSDARAIDDNVRTLQQGLSALSEVLISVSLAWSSNPQISAAQSGPDRALWLSVKDSISRCTTVLERFQQTLSRVSPENDGISRNILKRGVSRIKFNFSLGDIEGFRAEIDVYHRVLNIALNSINTCAIIRRDRTDGAVFERLNAIETGIEALTQKLNTEKKSSATLGSDAAHSLNGFLKAAKEFHSSASQCSSSGSTIKGENSTERGGSIFGEPLSKEHVNHIEGWIPAPLNEILEGPITDIASSSGWNGSLQEVETLPQLMSVLENVAQMADRFQAVEKQKSFTKDEEIRALQQKCEKLEADLEEASAVHATQQATEKHLYDVLMTKYKKTKLLFCERCASLEEAEKTRDALQKEVDRLGSELGKLCAGFENMKGNYEESKKLKEFFRAQLGDIVLVNSSLEIDLLDEKNLNKTLSEKLDKQQKEGQRLKQKFVENITRQATELFDYLASPPELSSAETNRLEVEASPTQLEITNPSATAAQGSAERTTLPPQSPSRSVHVESSRAASEEAPLQTPLEARPSSAAGPSVSVVLGSTSASRPQSSFPHAFERWETLSAHWEGLTSFWIRMLEKNNNEINKDPLSQRLSKQVTDLSAAGANLFHAVVELQRLRASSERKFQRWFFEVRAEQERAQEIQALTEQTLEKERREHATAIANAIQRERQKLNVSKQSGNPRAD